MEYKLRERYKMSNNWVEQHERVKKAVDDEKDCVNVYDFAKKLNEDFQKIMQHFEVMIIDGYGNFMSDEKKIFCTIKTPSKILDYIAKQKEKI